MTHHPTRRLHLTLLMVTLALGCPATASAKSPKWLQKPAGLLCRMLRKISPKRVLPANVLEAKLALADKATWSLEPLVDAGKKEGAGSKQYNALIGKQLTEVSARLNDVASYGSRNKLSLPVLKTLSGRLSDVERYPSPANLTQMKDLLNVERALPHVELFTTHYVGTLRQPVLLYRYSVTGKLPQKIQSTVFSLDRVTTKAIQTHVRGDLAEIDKRVSQYLGYCCFYAANDKAARLTSAGNGMPDYKYLVRVKVKAGTRVLLVNGDGENEVVIRDPKAMTMIGEPIPFR